MNPALRDFVRQYLAVCTMALAPVVLTAFVSMPWMLGRHPGEAEAVAAASTASGVSGVSGVSAASAARS